MRAPHRIDLNISDVLAVLPSLFSRRPTTETQNLSGGSRALITLSVRSAVDLYFRTLALPHGSEVIVSAITHPDIGEILRAHGLIPVPVDLHFESAAPLTAAVLGAASNRTRVVMIAHLFGATVGLDEIAAACRERGWLLLEDCAQTFGGGYEGHSKADAVLFSFGPLKTATALGGALTVVRDENRYGQMLQTQRSYPRRSGAAFMKRLVLYSLLRVITQPVLYTAVYSLLHWLKYDPSEIMRRMTKSFSGPFDILHFRQQLSIPQTKMLKRRVKTLNCNAIRKRSAAGEQLGRALGLRRFGGLGMNHTHWIFPVTIAEPEAALRALECEGIHAMRGLSNLAIIDSHFSENPPGLETARHVLASSLLVPLPSEPGDQDHIQRIVRAISVAESGNRRN